MFGLEELKKKIEVEGDTIICPIIGCENQVKKMAKGVLKSLDAYLEKGESNREKFDQCLCKEHKIYITPTTFIYEDLRDNLLWYDVDKDFLDKIIVAKRNEPPRSLLRGGSFLYFWSLAHGKTEPCFLT
ncbi:hypothetical protein HKBW3S43_00111 [Candidatus Hakubella thermalkaliphila]|uniref:Uncharacterized protein n=1 Tax=Candidatus Hakubella thermalkaliphila TaxID=2754717 RepID=A0A6V8P513_9ACTN|nr:hypothetical protein [Candidatus Hakubella thermalkaliphila]GFP24687.1 hypothetical protein HKBW3S25_00124 [Candidatus Hakubella thermalkaliphila]GFP27692.1 hypothetical protein HKBW3S33_01102 [Candidatus Hakubella thermalkaliphila]GFP34318.1 hypothetical protein HKBW3S43_00111 [Candidatus Hakubella thermalkaliphila]GFP43429.1 hypothetical protein HKBW3C_02559 [Candidatus Hakubella thermalkaliphila]